MTGKGRKRIGILEEEYRQAKTSSGPFTGGGKETSLIKKPAPRGGAMPMISPRKREKRTGGGSQAKTMRNMIQQSTGSTIFCRKGDCKLGGHIEDQWLTKKVT